MNCTTIEMVHALVDSDTQTIRARNFIPVPPFLIGPISTSIDSNKGNPVAVFLDVIKAIKAFDDLNKEDTSFTEKAATKCKLLLHWFYVAMNNEVENGIAQLHFAPCTDDELLAGAKQFKQAHFVSPHNPQAEVTQALINPLEKLAASSQTTQEALIRMTMLQEKVSSSSDKALSKIPECYMNMLLNACSVGEAKPSSLGDEAVKFFSLPGVKHALIHLNSLLENKGISIKISHAVANALYCGAFKWSNLVTPSGLSASVLETESFLRNDILRDAMVLEANTKFSISEEYVEKLTSTSIQFPTTSEQVIDRFKAMQELATLFFQMESFIAQFYISLVNWATRCKKILDVRITMDPKFIAKFLVATDERVNIYLDSCMKAESPREVSHRYLNHRSICNDIEVNSFFYSLPSSVKLVSATPPGAGTKRKADDSLQQLDRVKNHNMVEAWKLRPGENYTDVFQDKVSSGPLLSMGCYGCHKFHNKGFCYSDCRNAKSHCTLKGDDFNQFDKRIKVLRDE